MKIKMSAFVTKMTVTIFTGLLAGGALAQENPKGSALKELLEAAEKNGTAPGAVAAPAAAALRQYEIPATQPKSQCYQEKIIPGDTVVVGWYEDANSERSVLSKINPLSSDRFYRMLSDRWEIKKVQSVLRGDILVLDDGSRRVMSGDENGIRYSLKKLKTNTMDYSYDKYDCYGDLASFRSLAFFDRANYYEDYVESHLIPKLKNDLVSVGDASPFSPTLIGEKRETPLFVKGVTVDAERSVWILLENAMSGQIHWVPSSIEIKELTSKVPGGFLINYGQIERARESAVLQALFPTRSERSRGDSSRRGSIIGSDDATKLFLFGGRPGAVLLK